MNYIASKKNIKYLLLLLVLLFSLQSCAYFNTFYNAKVLFRQAQVEYTKTENKDKLSRSTITKLEKASEKALKIIDEYPESKYVDDAMYIIGVANYQMQKYTIAGKMFFRLTMEFPQSEFFEESQLWIVKCHYNNGEKKRAFDLLEKFISYERNKAYFGDAMALAATLSFEEGREDDAFDYFNRAIDLTDDLQKKVDILYNLASIYVDKELLDEAKSRLKEIEAMTLDPEMLGKVQLQYAKIFRLQKEYAASEELIKEMLTEDQNINIKSDLELELAQIYENMGDIDRAIDRYKLVIETYGKTPQAAIASFRVGEIYLYKKMDFSKAKTSYIAVNAHNRNIFEADEAKKKISIIGKYNLISNKKNALIKKSPKLTDSPLAYYKELADSAKVDSLKNVDFEIFKESAKEYVDQLFSEAEILAFTFSLFDSSISIYKNIEKNFYYTSILPQLYNTWAYILDVDLQDSVAAAEIYKKLTEKYPDSDYTKRYFGIVDSNFVKKKMDMKQLHSIESTYLDAKKYKLAVDSLRVAIPKMNDYNLKANAIFYIAWIYDTHYSSMDSALVYYQRVADNFTESPFAKESRERIIDLTNIINELATDSTFSFESEN